VNDLRPRDAGRTARANRRFDTPIRVHDRDDHDAVTIVQIV
jgi:hypothetical protein